MEVKIYFRGSTFEIHGSGLTKIMKIETELLIVSIFNKTKTYYRNHSINIVMSVPPSGHYAPSGSRSTCMLIGWDNNGYSCWNRRRPIDDAINLFSLV